MSLRQYGLYKEYLLLPLLFVAVTVKCWKCFRIKQINETDQCKMEVSRLKVGKVGGVAFIINFNMRISRHVCDLRHAKRVVQACRERAFTFSIKFLWTVTYIKNKLMLFLLWLSVQGSFFFLLFCEQKTWKNPILWHSPSKFLYDVSALFVFWITTVFRWFMFGSIHQGWLNIWHPSGLFTAL